MFETSKEKANSAKDNKSHIVDDIKGAAQHLKDDARSVASDAIDDLENVARQTGRRVRKLAESAEHGIEDAGGAITAKIRDNPVQSSLIALGIGLIAGMLYRR